MSSATRIARMAIAGTGRMAMAVAAALERDGDTEVAGHWSRGGDLSALLANADVLVDFTLPEATTAIAEACEDRRCPLVCGVTGLDAAGEAAIERAAAAIPVVYDRNMSVGIAALTAALPELAAALGPGYRVAISETHHVHKKDAPSGTALKLGEALTAALPDVSIDYSSERRGEVPGDHEVCFESASETVRLAHSVVTRDVFADGAVRAARWVLGRAPGRYAMRDVLSAE